jgi:hypothetical protein
VVCRLLKVASTMKSLLLALAVLASGCVLYGGDDDGDDDVCAYEGDIAAAELRNPDTGSCESWGGGGGCYGAPEPWPDWASCYSECEGLDEQGCLATSGCRAAYWQETCPPWADCDASWQPPTFYGCWGTAPSGPTQGACDGLSAYDCSRHDDCVAVYDRDWNAGDEENYNRFSYCAPEPWTQGCYSDSECPAGYECTADTECYPPPGCEDGQACPDVCYGRCVPSQNGCEAVDCGPGYHCELQCYPCDPVDPDDGSCDYPCEVTCVPDSPNTCSDGMECPPGSHCVEVCNGGGTDPGGGGGGCTPEECYPEYCWSECVDDTPDPGTCDGDVYCDALPPACPDGTVPGISNGCWSGYCIPVEDCAPNDPGECYAPVACDMAPPACPEGSTPGVRDGCYTGYCIPVWACDSSVTCESLTTEAACAARADCQALYEGTGCTCYPDGTCTCEEWQFARCETGNVEPQPL